MGSIGGLGAVKRGRGREREGEERLLKGGSASPSLLPAPSLPRRTPPFVPRLWAASGGGGAPVRKWVSRILCQRATSHHGGRGRCVRAPSTAGWGGRRRGCARGDAHQAIPPPLRPSPRAPLPVGMPPLPTPDVLANKGRRPRPELCRCVATDVGSTSPPRRQRRVARRGGHARWPWQRRIV